MAEKIKFTRKDLRKPDKIRELLSHALEDASRHFNKIVIGIGILVLFFIIAYVISSGDDKKELLASQQFDTALQAYNTGQTIEALDMFMQLYKEYPKKKISKLGLYYTGIINYEIEKYDESINNLKTFLDSNLDEKIINDSAYLTLGLAKFNLDKWDESIDYLSKIDNESSPYYDQAKLHLGLSYEKKGDFEKSKVIFNEVLTNRNSRFNLPPGVIRKQQ